MKISKEFKIGIVVTSAIGLFLWGFNFLKGNDLFNHKYVLYAVYPKIDGLSLYLNVLTCNSIAKVQLFFTRTKICYTPVLGNR